MSLFHDRSEERSWYDTAQVCLNGHTVNDSSVASPEHNKKFCDQCGAPSISTCQECQAPIKGDYHVSGVFGISHYTPPKFCENCGKPYPWTTAKLQAAIDLADELDSLTDGERETLRKSLPDIIRDTPQTAVAATRFKKLLAKAKDKAAPLVWEGVKEIVTEAAKKIILGQ